jgi:exodeoxyribonuclease VII large subunit
MEQRLDELSFRMEAAMQERLRDQHQAVAELGATVLRHDPRRQLGIARETLALCQSRLNHALDRSLAGARNRCVSQEARLYRAVQVSIAARRSAYTELRGELMALSPLAVLQRGYALVRDEKGAVVRSVHGLSANQALSTHLADGEFTSQILKIEPNQAAKTARKKKEKTTQP